MKRLFIFLLTALCMSAASPATEPVWEGPVWEEPIHEPSPSETLWWEERPHEEAPLFSLIAEVPPSALSHFHQPLAKVWERLLHSEHDQVRTELDEHPLGLLPVPSRPPLVLELNESFLSSGWLTHGVETPSGAVWRPALWVFGEFRTAFAYFDDHDMAPVADWANRLDLFAQLNLTATERLLLGYRPLDEEDAPTGREFAGYDFHDGDWTDGLNGELQTAFFEGDFGELFPFLDPLDVRQLDYGFAVGRMPLLAQQGLLINEDRIDALTVTRNTLSFWGLLNLRATGLFAWDEIHRNSVDRANRRDANSRMYGLLTESDFYHATVNVDGVYVESSDQTTGDLAAFGVSSIARIYGYENTYNTSLHWLASVAPGPKTPYADDGHLFFAQTSWTPHHTHDLIYVNAFWAIDQFTSPARGPLMGGPLGQTGILFAPPALGRAGAPLSVATDNSFGASVGWQWFFHHLREQLIWELGGYERTRDGAAAIATGLRWQRACGQHTILVIDGFVGKEEHEAVSQGARVEARFKF